MHTLISVPKRRMAKYLSWICGINEWIKAYDSSIPVILKQGWFNPMGYLTMSRDIFG